MKNITLAVIALSLAAGFAPAAFAGQNQGYKEQCAISHGNWNNAPVDSCYTLEYGHGHQSEATVSRSANAT